MNPIIAGLGTTIFEEMSQLARQYDAINLGQGFPDGDGPEDVRQAAADALFERSNQYPPMAGLPELRQAVADHYRLHQGIHLASDHVLITSGATEALAASLLALVSPGDEVLLIQPMYDAYRPLVERAGGVVRTLTLDAPGFRLTPELVDQAFTRPPRILIFNNPLNPAARVFDEGEVALLAQACRRHGTIAICDEVWEHLVFDGRRHHPLIAQPGMAGLAVKIGSAGKIFSMTGWKVGFVVANPDLLRPILRAHQYLTFTTSPALQAGVAFGLGKHPGSFDAMRQHYARSRDILIAHLIAAGYSVLPSEGTYFVCIDLEASGIAATDRDFCLRSVREAGVAAIPLSAFYGAPAPQHLVRLCFAKADAVLATAGDRLSRIRALYASSHR